MRQTIELTTLGYLDLDTRKFYQRKSNRTQAINKRIKAQEDAKKEKYAIAEQKTMEFITMRNEQYLQDKLQQLKLKYSKKP